MAEKAYELNVAGLTRYLPIVRINDKMSIAVFIMFSDVEMTIRSAEELLKKVPEFDLILTAEAKGIPLAYEMAKQSKKNYIVARKMSKLYMEQPVQIEVQSITTANKQLLFLDSNEVEKIRGKRILITDDVISTGGSVYALEKLVKMAGGEIVGRATILAEGVAADRDDIIFLKDLPVFFD